MKSINSYFYFCILLSFLLLINSCRKDKLSNEREMLVGKWNWFMSATGPISNSNVKYELTYPADKNCNYQLQFLEKGVLDFYNCGDKADSKRLVFEPTDRDSKTIDCSFAIIDTWSVVDSASYNVKAFYILRNAHFFEFSFDNIKNETFGIAVNQDTLVTSIYPPNNDQSTHAPEKISFFVRE